jgi:hypothetical protein
LKHATCPRLWEAEAVEDGRLDAAARASFERHVSACGTCADERASLGRLRAMSEHLTVLSSTPLERRRLRAAILRAENHRMLGDSSGSRKAGYALAAAVVATAIALGVSYRHEAAPAVASQGAPLGATFEVSPLGSADWHLDRQDRETRVSLRDGTVSIHVAKLDSEQRFVLVLPDAELEVHGTRFTVHVAEGRTTSVSVSEGNVSLAWSSGARQILAAGESWQASETHSALEPTARAESSSDSRQSAVVPPSSRPPSPTPVQRRRVSASAPASASAQESALDSSRSPEAAGAAFAEAMRAFSSGSYERADSLLARFRDRFPGDARGEDADFMLIVVQKRLGHAEGARECARDYLRRHPGGFRRAEVERFLQ